MPLRDLLESDLPMILDWRNSEKVRNSMYNNHIISWEEHLDWFERIKADNSLQWLIYYNQNEDLGVIYFTNLDLKNRSSFWGFYTKPNAPRGSGTLLGIDALDHFFLY